MGWFGIPDKNSGIKHVPAKARDPRPKGAQKGVARRDVPKQGKMNWGGKARAGWIK